MDLRRLRYFIAVAEELHFGRAADKVHVVQSAVSRQIKLLEEELGFALFTRTRQKVKLTIPGEIFLPEAYAILQRADEGVELARASAGGAVGRLTIGFVDVALWAALPETLRNFRTKFPDIDLKLRQLDRIAQVEALEASVIDIGILPSPPPPDPNIETLPLTSASMIAVLPDQHPFAGKEEIALADLAGEPFVLFPPRMRSRLLEIVINACSTVGFMPRVVQEAEQLHTLMALVNAGLGVTLAPSWVTKSHAVGVCYARLIETLPTYDLLIAWRTGSANVAIDQFRSIANAESPD